MTAPTGPRHPLALAAELDMLLNDTCEYAGDLEGTPDELMDRLISIKFKAIHLRHTLRAQSEAEAGLRAALVHYAELRHYDHAGRLWSGDPDEHEDAQVDFGEIARAALAQAGGEG